MTVLLEYIDRLAATYHKCTNIAINEFYFTVMLNAFSDPLYSNGSLYIAIAKFAG